MKNIPLTQLLHDLEASSLGELIHQSQSEFIDHYELIKVLNEEVRLIFESASDAQMFYTDCQLGHRFLRNVGVYYDMNDEKVILLKPIQTIVSLLKGDSSLLGISKALDLNFKLEYTQAFTNHELELYIQNGQINQPKCIIYYNPEYVSLSLGRLYKLMNNEQDFEKLNTIIYPIQSEMVL